RRRASRQHHHRRAFDLQESFQSIRPATRAHPGCHHLHYQHLPGLALCTRRPRQERMNVMIGGSARWLRRLALGVSFLFTLVLNLGPIVWGIVGSLRPRSEIMQYPPSLIPREISTEHYRTIVDNGFVGAI